MKRIVILLTILLMVVCVLNGCKIAAPEQTQGSQNASEKTPSVVNTAMPVPSEEPDTDTRDMSEKVAQAIQQYCPDGTFIINLLVEKAQTNPYKNGADFLGGVKRWTDMFQNGGTYDTVFSAAGVIVHEETHAFQHMDWASHYANGSS